MSKMQEKTRPELLAPAGSLEAFFAAMEKGADAVYAGLNEFSARAKAKNFTLSQMERITTYAHSLGRKVYVTLNTLIKERELPRLVDILAALSGMRTDGVILQDMGVFRLIREYFPEIPLHASTQMTIHNTAGVKQLEKMGFQRAVLARELYIDEIGAITKATAMEIECFIHGALCFSISGQCYFSSFLGGYSGNRGRCAQPCRRHYRYRGKEGYYFSTNDFSSIDMLPQLVEAGVASLKIEGRMKSAEYVASVVGAYRMTMDAPPHRRADTVAEAKELLKLSFGRVPTKGFLASRNPTDIATPSLKGATGRYLGDIQAVRGDRITFASRDRLHIGERIRVQPKSDRAGRAFTVKELFVGKQQVKAAREKSIVSTVAPFACKNGDSVFKISSETAFTMSENACLRKLESVKGYKIPCNLAITGDGRNMIVKALLDGREYSFEFSLGELEPARTSDMEGVLRGQFERTGETPFVLQSLSAPGFPAVFIPAGMLKDIRREFYRQLADKALAGGRRRREETRETALSGLVGEGPVKRASHPESIVRLESVKDFHVLTHEGVDAVSFPVSKANIHQLPLFARKLKGREAKVSWRLPFIIFDSDMAFYRSAVESVISFGFRRFELSNLSHFQMLEGLEAEMSLDYRLFSLNSQAMLVWKELGADSVTLYVEDDAENTAILLRAAVPVEKRVILYSEIPLITSKIGIKDVRGDSPVVSDRGDEYTVRVQDGLTVVVPRQRFSLSGHREELQRMGCEAFIVDLSHEPREHWKRVLAACARGEALPDTSEFNFVMGLA
jgi:putative protease